MGIKSVLSKPLSRWISAKIRSDSMRAMDCQEQVFRELIDKGRESHFGREHDFPGIQNFSDFRQRVPIRDYEGIKDRIEEIAEGRRDVLWPGLPLYFAKTSGTTSGSKYIPITRDSISNHIDTARNAILEYISRSGNSEVADHKMIFLQGSPVLGKHGVIDTGRLSGIVAHHVPAYLQKNVLPSWETNCIDDWEEKVDAIVQETIRHNLSIISGIPSWLRMYFEKLVKIIGKPVGEIFPGLKLLVYGGVNFEPYRPAFERLLGRHVDTIETFPASEGFFAFQDQLNSPDLLLNIHSGIFYEFVLPGELDKPDPGRLTIGEVTVGVDYALIISSNAGLWSYSVGDTVRFTSLLPPRIIVSGRTAQYLSAFGEHVIASEIEGAMAEALLMNDTGIAEFTVAPLVNPSEGKPRHQWVVEFDRPPVSVEKLAEDLDAILRRKNSYYDDLVTGHVLERLLISPVPRGTFRDYLESQGILGGQNKVPRLGNNRHIVDGLLARAHGGKPGE